MPFDARRQIRMSGSTKGNAVDVLIVGCGLSGIAAACHLKMKCPEKSFAILESRPRIGGTWDLFRYPGVRADSDFFTLGFSFKPWEGSNVMADGTAIREYLHETVAEFELDRHIHCNSRALNFRWSSTDECWTVQVRNPVTQEEVIWTTKFNWNCTGYYRYSGGYTPPFADMGKFNGQIVHPQLWEKEDCHYENKRVVVIGSGATAVTLVPSLSKKASHVTMLQRTPTYIAKLPARDRIADLLRVCLPRKLAHWIIRWTYILFTMSMYQLARHVPGVVRTALKLFTRLLLRCDSDYVNTHFDPPYDPWDQRLCVTPDGDFFDAIRCGDASIVTDHIDRFTESGILLDSGEMLEADVIVTATGLQVEISGGSTIEVDGKPVDLADKFVYKGLLISDIPNTAMSRGYTNASWTLKIELVCEYVCRLLAYMEQHDYNVAVPRVPDPNMETMPFMDLSSGYIQRAIHLMPKQGRRVPWRFYQNYILDSLMIRYSRIDDGCVEFRSGKRPNGEILKKQQ